MAVLPVIFRGASNEIINYDYIDVIQGQGILHLYGARVETGAATSSYILTSNSGLDAHVDNVYYTWFGTGTPSVELNFDITLAKTTTIEGNAYLCFTAGTNDTSSSLYFKARVIHYDGSSETALCSAVQTSSLSAPGAAIEGSWGVRLPLTRKLFAAGDILRLELECYGVTMSGNNGWILHSPTNQAPLVTATKKSMLQLFIPVEVKK